MQATNSNSIHKSKNNKNKLAKLRGVEAIAVLGELDRGAAILFSAYVDKNNNPVVELYSDEEA